MKRAGRFHGIRDVGIVVVVVARLAFLSRRESQWPFTGGSLVRRLVAADITEVPGIVRELNAYRRWADPCCDRAIRRGPDGF